ncbi:MAG: hypothetical protein EHM40_03320 [Chloroflexi bacterium]|nr:MAG: hypothetical protein EHM40_03320 [Chloroflexota bacterium]
MGSIIKGIGIVLLFALAISMVTFALSGSFNSPVKDAQQQATAAVIFARMTPSPSATSPFTTPTMSLYELGLTEIAQREDAAAAREQQLLDLQLTKDANDLALEREKLQVEKLSIQATADEKSRLLIAEADNKTAVAYDQMRTAQAADTRTAVAVGTQGAETQSAISTHAVQTSIAATNTAPAIWTQTSLDNRIKEAQAKEVELALQRTQVTNFVKAWGPWALLLACTYVGSTIGIQWVKTRTHARDDHGRTPTIQKETKDGTILVNPDQLETGLVKIGRDGAVIRYAPMDQQEQTNINRGRSVADIVGQLPPSYGPTGKALAEKFFGVKTNNQPRLFVRGDGSLAPAMDEADDRMLQEEVEA